uniref:Uncharacterized protein n=1 Tax=Medicago truncatula TaxID=3880 RepID=I3SQQ2_MEDTR|nr:unknown [Medicago truncatula]
MLRSNRLFSSTRTLKRLRASPYFALITREESMATKKESEGGLKEKA